MGKVPILDKPDELLVDGVGDIEPDDDNELDDGD